jgi:hypothetical protein
MEFVGAYVKERDFGCWLVRVSPRIFEDPVEREKVKKAVEFYFRGTPVVLCLRRADGKVRFWGPEEVVRKMSRYRWTDIPWKKYRVGKKKA